MNTTVNWNAFSNALAGKHTGESFVNEDSVTFRSAKVAQDLEDLKKASADAVKRVKEDSTSVVRKIGLDPTGGLGYAANLGASLVSGAARVGGQLASLPASIGAMHDSSQLDDTHYQAYDRYQQGTASKQDMDLLQSNIYDDGRADTKNFMQAIESANNKRELARDIAERFNLDSIVSKGNRRGISEDLSKGFGDSWGKVKEGWNGGEYGKVATGLGELALNAGSAVANNKMGVAEYIAENVPQLAVGAFGKVGGAVMAASNAGYAADEYNKGIIKHQAEHGGSMPSDKQRNEMGGYAATLALAEQASDVFQLKGILRGVGKAASKEAAEVAASGSLKEAILGAGKSVAKGATNAAYKVGKPGLVEGATEGWQTYAEGKANLTPATPEQIYEGATIGAAVGSGMHVGGSTAATVVGTATGIKEGWKASKAEANKQSEINQANDAAYKAAVDTGNVDAYLDNKSPSFSPDKAMGVLFELSQKPDITPEQKVQYSDQAKKVMDRFEAEINSLKPDNTDELKKELASIEAELASYPPTDTARIELGNEMVAFYKESIATAETGGLSEQDLTKRNKRIAELEPKLASATELYDSLLHTNKHEATKDIDVDTEVASLASGNKESASKLRILSMASPSSISAVKALEIADMKDSGLTEGERQYFRDYAAAEQAIGEAKKLKHVQMEVLVGNEKNNQKGLKQYRERFGMYAANNDKRRMDKELNGLANFMASHETKIDAITEARKTFAETNKEQLLTLTSEGKYVQSVRPEGYTEEQRKKDGTILVGQYSGQLQKVVESELTAMKRTATYLESAAKLASAKEAQVTTAAPTTPAANPVTTVTPAASTPLLKSPPSVYKTYQKIETAKLLGAGLIIAPALEGGDYAASLGRAAIDEGKNYDPRVHTDLTGKTVLTSVPGRGRKGSPQYTGLAIQIARVKSALDSGATVRTDGEKIANSSYNSVGEGVLRKALIEGGYFEQTGEHYSSWTKPTTPVEPSVTQSTDTKEKPPVITNEVSNTVVQDNSVQPSEITAPVSDSDEVVEQQPQEEESQEAVQASNEEVGQDTTEDPVTEGKLDVIANAPEGSVLRTLKQSAGSANAVTKKPLVAVKDFLSRVNEDIGWVDGFISDAATADEQAVIEGFMVKAKQLGDTFQSMLIKDNPEYAVKNMAEFLMTGEDKKPEVEENIRTAVAVAIASWVASEINSPLHNKKEKVNGLLSRKDKEKYPSKRENELLGTVGDFRSKVADSIGSKVIELLGIKDTSDTPSNFLPNLKATVGLYAVHTMLKSGLAVNDEIKAKDWNEMTGDKENSANQNFVRIARDKNKNPTRQAQELADLVRYEGDVIGTIFGVEMGPSKASFEPVKFNQKIVSNGSTKVPKKYAKVLAKKNAEPNFLKQKSWDIVKQLNPHVIARLGGAKPTTGVHVDRLDGLNAKNEGLLKNAEAFLSFVQNDWTNQGLDKPIFLDHVLWKNQRAGLANTVMNPQTDKLVRHLLVRESWKSTITKDGGETENGFKLRIMESFGIKTEKDMASIHLGKWNDLIARDEVKKGLEALDSLMEGNNSKEVQVNLMQAVSKLKGKYHALDGLIALHEYMKIPEGGSFETDLVGEIDGVNNGPILTHMLLGTTDFKSMFKLLAKGGIYSIKGTYKNYGQYRAESDELDLYESLMSNIHKEIGWRIGVDPRITNIWGITGNLVDEEDNVTGEGRDLVKRPTAAIHFGSSINSAIEGMAGTFLDMLYGRIEDVVKNDGAGKESLIDSINQMLPKESRWDKNMLTADMLLKSFSKKDIAAIEDYFKSAMKEPATNAINGMYAGFINIRTQLNTAASVSYELYDTIYSALRKEYVAKLGLTKWDLTTEQESEFEKTVQQYIPRVHTVASKADGDLSAGLIGYKSKKRQSKNKAYLSQIRLNPKNSSEARKFANVSAMQQSVQEPGVGLLSGTIHSFDGMVSHDAIGLSEALNLHDANGTGVNLYNDVARNLNQSLWNNAVSYSPAIEMYRMMDRVVANALQLMADPNTSTEVRNAIAQTIKDAEKQYKEDFSDILANVRDTANISNNTRLHVLSKIGVVDQYALEGGQYDVTDADRNKVLEEMKKPKVRINPVIQQILPNLESILKNAGKPETKEREWYEDTDNEAISMLKMSDKAIQQMLAVIADLDSTEPTIKGFARDMAALMKADNLSFVQAAEGLLNDHEAIGLIQYLYKNQIAASITKYGAVGTPTIEAHAGLVERLETHPEMTGKEALRMLNSLLGTDTSYFKTLAAVIFKAIGDDVKVVYVKPDSNIEAKDIPASAARGWFVTDSNTIYVLSDSFVDSGVTPEMLLHELIHAAISGVMNNPSTPRQKQAVANLERMLKSAKEYVTQNNLEQYQAAVENVHELVAWGMTNQDFQKDVLVHMPSDTESKTDNLIKGMKTFINNLVTLLTGSTDIAKDKVVNTALADLLSNTTFLYKEAAENKNKVLKKAATSTNQMLMMANTSGLSQKIDNYTTAEVLSELDGGTASVDFISKLDEVLDTLVSGLHTKFGSVKTKINQAIGGTALDSWADSVAKGERPFIGKVLSANLNMSSKEAYVAEQVEAVMEDVLANKHGSNSMVYREIEKVYEQARTALKGKISDDLHKFVFTNKTGEKKANHMSTFVALSMASEEFSKALGFETKNLEFSFKDKTVLERLAVLWRASVDWLGTKMTGTHMGQLGSDRMNNLVRKLVSVELRNKDNLKSGQSMFNFMEPLEANATELIGKAKDKVAAVAAKDSFSNNRIAAIAAASKVVKLIAGNKLDAAATALNDVRNTLYKDQQGEAMQLLNYIKGPGEWMNHMIRLVKQVESTRQHYISDTAKEVLASFKDGGAYLDKNQKEAISSLVLRTGSHTLLDKYGITGFHEMVEDSTKLKQAITDEEALLLKHPEAHYWFKQAKGLGFMAINGFAGVARQNLNARGIARLHMTGKNEPDYAADVEQNIERLISLYALSYAPSDKKHHLTEVLRTEAQRGSDNGVEMTLRMHKFLDKQARETTFAGSESLMQHGYLPEVHDPRVEFQVARSAEEIKELEDLGYEFKFTIPQDAADPDQRTASMYVLNGGGLPRRVSGAFSLSNMKAKGSMKHDKYFNSTDDKGTNNIASMHSINNANQAEVDAQFKPDPFFVPSKTNRLVPLVNSKGELVDYRYMMKHDQRDEILKRDNRFEHLLGVMAGTTYDKMASRDHNKQLAQGLMDHFKAEYGKNPNNFILVGKNSTDPEMKELWDLLPDNTKKDISSIWGKQGLMVPKAMVVNIFGYRKASMADLFTKENRNKMEQGTVDFINWVITQYAIHRKGLTGQAAKDYAKRSAVTVRRAEAVVFDIVKEMKNNIVIKTSSVLFGNISSNQGILLMNGLSYKSAVELQFEGLKAVMSYQTNRKALAALKMKLDIGYGVSDEDEIRSEIIRLEEDIKRNPAYELIDAGLLPTIVDDVSMEDNPYSYKSEFVEWMDKKTSGLNRHVVRAGREMYMAHDTTMYKLMSNSTQYSDFVGRYALYKHLTKRKKNPLSKADAAFQASESFVLYDAPIPRTLQYLDDIGVVRFIKYFLSIQRVLVRLVRDKPLNVINTLALNNMLVDMPMPTDSSMLRHFGNNPFNPSVLGYPGAVADIATVNTVTGMFK